MTRAGKGYLVVKINNIHPNTHSEGLEATNVSMEAAAVMTNG